MRRSTLCALVILGACGGHHGGGHVEAPPLCDPSTDPNCGTPVQPIIVSCPGCPTFPNPGTGTTCSNPATDPQLVYPPDGVLLPPNMNVIAVQFMPGQNNAYFEIDFENSVTDVRLETQCNDITNTRGTDTGGCDFELDPTDWMYVAMHNKGGDPVTVTVRGMPTDMSCVAGSNSRNIAFAEEDLSGGIYYWQSVKQGGVAGLTGGIFRKDFGNPDPTPEPFLTPGNLNKCVGCHVISRDGLKMVFGDDDADSDDEYGDLKAYIYDIASRTAGTAQVATGFQTYEGTGHDFLFASDGTGKSTTAEMLQFYGSTGAAALTTSFTGATGLTGKRVTHPDTTRDGGTVYFTAATPVTGVTGYNRIDDLHVTNGGIWYAPVTAGTGGATIGTPVELVTPASADENDYYPTISPDGSALVFDRAVGTTLATHDSYNNPNATLYGMIVPSGTPIPLANANLHDTLTNSWPRWSPFVQMYKGKRIAWITFSSTRDYGVRVQNENLTPATFNCYPPVSPENASTDHKQPFDPNCTQPQIWMTAVSIDDLAAGSDGSFPAFWLPFQDFTAHNHIAQWADVIVPPPPNCALPGQSCATQMCCPGETCDATTKTCVSVIP